MKQLVIVGTSAFAEIAFQYFSYLSDYTVVAFSCEETYITKASLFDRPIVPFEKIEDFYPPDKYEIYVAVVYTQLNYLRERLYNRSKEKGYKLASFIHPQAQVWNDIKIGEHCFIFENNVVQPFVEIGNNIVLWSGNHIGHHSIIRDHVFISSHVVISGFCDIGEHCFFGVNATLADRVKIERDSFVGPNTLITKSSTKENAVFTVKPTEPQNINSHRLFKVPKKVNSSEIEILN